MKSVVFLSLLSFVLTSCSMSNIGEQYTASKGGIVLTFDDHSVSDWYDADSLLEKYHWRATFCVSNYEGLSASDIHQLRMLQDKGHEIAGHGLSHIDAESFAEKNGLEEYLKTEIEPMLTLMKEDSFHVSSFAYPFGHRTPEIDNALVKYFSILRGTAYGKKNPKRQKCYYNTASLVYGIGIDKSYKHFDIAYLDELLKYARDHKKILIVYCHTPKETAVNDYEVELSTLKHICSYVSTNDMLFYTLNDLSKLM